MRSSIIQLILALALLLATPSSFGTGQGTAQGPCPTAIEQITQHSYRPYLKDLPEKLSLPKTDAEITVLFDVTKWLYKRDFPRNKVLKVVEKINAGKASDLSKSDFKKLKEARKLSQVVRSSLYLFTALHNPPADFDDFVRYFGKITDQKRVQSLKKGMKARENAARVANHLKAGHDAISSYNLQIGSAASFADFMERQILMISTLMDRPDLTVDQYHYLRQWVRDFKILFDLKDIKENTSESNATARYFTFLNTELGDSKDDLKDEEKKADEEVRTSVDPDFKILIREFLRRFDLPSSSVNSQQQSH